MTHQPGVAGGAGGAGGAGAGSAWRRVRRALNVLTQWRPKGSPECDAVRDHGERTILLHAEVTAFIALCRDKGGSRDRGTPPGGVMAISRDEQSMSTPHAAYHVGDGIPPRDPAVAGFVGRRRALQEAIPDEHGSRAARRAWAREQRRKEKEKHAQ